MSVGFQLSHNDQKPVEDYVLRHHGAVGAVTLHAKSARHQTGAAEAAKAGGAAVYFDPATERLCAPGYRLPHAPYFPDQPYDLDALAADAQARAQLVEQVLAGHPETVTAATPPHFFVHDARSANLNLVLASDTRNSTDSTLRGLLVVDRRYAAKHAEDLAQSYAQAGITCLELRLSPLGGEDESLAKVQTTFATLDTFRDAGISVTLGLSGNLGHTAVALGHADHYSVGVGLLERVSHTSTINRQQQPPKLDEAGKPKPTPAGDGVYLPGIAQTLARKRAKALLDHSDVRLRLGCRLEGCATSIAGPSTDPRRHYVHARVDELQRVMAKPAPWRATAEADRLTRALELRRLVNDKYLDGQPPLRTRTIESIIDIATGATGAVRTA